MSKQWYPVIDPQKCTKCGGCVKMCRNGVYDKSQCPNPVIGNPLGCVQGCHGCGNRCPYGAITYYGDRRDGVRQNEIQSEESKIVTMIC